MKIAIITSPLMSNYGGLLQNWALQQILKDLSPANEVVTFDQVDWVAPFYMRLGHRVKLKLGLSKPQPESVFDLFRKNHINASAKISSKSAIKKLERKFKPDVLIVGSDQVWRPSMVRDMSINFLSFSKNPNKIAYAASLGTDKWEFAPDQTQKAYDWIRLFKAVSVREASAIPLLQENLNIESILVLDPTLLLSAERYYSLIGLPENKNDSIFTYILDSTPEKRILTQEIIGNEREYNALYDKEGVKRTVPISVEEWLRGIRDSKAVVCDSFHGVAFSIVFNKEFFVLANPERGNTRIESILNQFDLKDRLVNDVNKIPLINPINWDHVDDKLSDLKSASFKFLESSL